MTRKCVHLTLVYKGFFYKLECYIPCIPCIHLATFLIDSSDTFSCRSFESKMPQSKPATGMVFVGQQTLYVKGPNTAKIIYKTSFFPMLTIYVLI